MTRALRTLLSLAATASLGLGCGPAPGAAPVPELDAPFYVEHVHPVVRFSCASLDCHGAENRPLRIYAEDGLRSRRELRTEPDDQPLAPDEAAWNVAAFAGIDPDPIDVDHSLVLQKPLARDAGGVAHEGGDLWDSTTEPPNRSYQCLHAWLAGETAQAAAAEACDLAAAALDPYPPAAP
jgi:hypothetical protein